MSWRAACPAGARLWGNTPLRERQCGRRHLRRSGLKVVLSPVLEDRFASFEHTWSEVTSADHREKTSVEAQVPDVSRSDEEADGIDIHFGE